MSNRIYLKDEAPWLSVSQNGKYMRDADETDLRNLGWVPASESCFSSDEAVGYVSEDAIGFLRRLTTGSVQLHASKNDGWPIGIYLHPDPRVQDLEVEIRDALADAVAMNKHRVDAINRATKAEERALELERACNVAEARWYTCDKQRGQLLKQVNELSEQALGLDKKIADLENSAVSLTGRARAAERVVIAARSWCASPEGTDECVEAEIELMKSVSAYPDEERCHGCEHEADGNCTYEARGICNFEPTKNEPCKDRR